MLSPLRDTPPSSSAPEGLTGPEQHPTFEEWKAELAEASLPARNRSALVDVTPLARHIGLLPPTALTSRLWADIQAIPPGFEETVHARLVSVLRNALFAIVENLNPDQADRVAEERLVFAVSLPTLGQEISDYPVVLWFRPGGSGRPVFTLMAPEEAASSDGSGHIAL